MPTKAGRASAQKAIWQPKNEDIAIENWNEKQKDETCKNFLVLILKNSE